MNSNTLYDIQVKNIRGEEISLKQYQGKALLIVNTASKCGFTNQYEGLEKIYKDYKEKGFEVLAFPCNQFGAQEPGTEDQIAQFCELTYQTSFPLFAKIDVNGDNAHPLFTHLKKQAPGLLGTEGIKWNFTKFLVDKNGQVVKRYAPQDTPAKIAEELKEIL